MRVSFRKITKEGLPFEIVHNDLECIGKMKRGRDLVDLDLGIRGDIVVSCDICAKEYIEAVDELFKLKVSDGCYDGDDMDVVEMHDGFLDLDFIVDSEIESKRSEYHYCEDCKKD
jgi:hypothetical protein